MPDKTLGGCLYYVYLIDNYSHKTWIYLLKTKDQVFEKFCEFKAHVENSTGGRIKRLRFDNGGEYVSNELINFYGDARIKRELIVPYYLEQNGIAKRNNKTNMEVAKAMIHDQELLMFLWGEATRTIFYVQNRCPHQILDYKTPKEIFICERLNVEHLIIFSCHIFFHVPKEKRTKLEPSRKKGNFVGYCENSKTFRVYITGE